MGTHESIGRESPIYRHLCSSPLFDPSLLGLIFEHLSLMYGTGEQPPPPKPVLANQIASSHSQRNKNKQRK
jgi:hypothetical protein